MSRDREEARAAKRKKRNAKQRGKALEKWVDEQCILRGIDEGEGVIKSVNWGVKRPDVVREKAWVKLLLECKNRRGWKSLEFMKWLDQAEGYLEQYDDIRWAWVVHCNSPGRGVERDPIVVGRLSSLLEMAAKSLEGRDGD